MGKLTLSSGQLKYMRLLELHDLVEDTGSSWFASVGYGFRHYRAHRTAVRELGDWVPWHDRPENKRQENGEV